MSRITAISTLASAASDAAGAATNGEAMGIATAFVVGLTALIDTWTDEDDGGRAEAFAIDVEDWLSAWLDGGSQPQIENDR